MVKATKATATAVVGFAWGESLKKSYVYPFKSSTTFEDGYEAVKNMLGDNAVGKYVVTADVDTHYDAFCKACAEFKVGMTFHLLITTASNNLKEVTGAKKLKHFGPVKSTDEDASADENEKPAKKAPAKKPVKKDDSDDDAESDAEEKPVKKAPAKKTVKKDDDDDEEEKPTKKAPAKKPVKKDDDDEEKKPVKKAPAKKPVKKDDSDDEEEAPKATPAKTSMKKVVSPKKPVKDSDDSDAEVDSDDE